MRPLCGHNNGALHRRRVKVAVVAVRSRFCEHERLILCEIVGRVEGVGITTVWGASVSFVQTT